MSNTSDTAPPDKTAARIAAHETEFSAFKDFRTAADFALQLIQRAVVWATIRAAASITNEPILKVVENVTFLLIFGWAVWSFGAARASLQARIKSEKLFHATAFALGFLEVALVVLVLFAGSKFVDALSARLEK